MVKLIFPKAESYFDFSDLTNAIDRQIRMKISKIRPGSN